MTPLIAEEAMDDPDLPAPTYAAVLCDLMRVNRLTLAAWPTLSFLNHAARHRSRLSILDVGFGAGDLLRAIAGWALKHGIETRLVGVDLNPNSAPVATALTPPHLGIEWRTGDWRDQGDEFDLILSSLVTHHMSPAERIAFLQAMERRARSGWHVNDLWRSRLALIGFAAVTAVLRPHPIVRGDGRLSIRRSFRHEDWRKMVRAAGIDGARVRLWPNLRLCVDRLK